MKYVAALLLIFANLSSSTNTLYYTKFHGVESNSFPMTHMNGVGARFQKDKYAFDVSFNFSAIFSPTSFEVFHIETSYLWFPKNKGFYFGPGFGVINASLTDKISPTVQAVLGWQSFGKGIRAFLETGVISPILTHHKKLNTIEVYPKFSAGIGF